jgi:hypothetical protein
VRNIKAAETTQRMMGGSPTAPRLARKGQKEAEAGLVAAAQSGSRGIFQEFLSRLYQNLIVERRNRPLASIISTPMSDMGRVSQHVHNLRQQADLLRQLAERRGTGSIAAAAAASENAGAMASPKERGQGLGGLPRLLGR